LKVNLSNSTEKSSLCSFGNFPSTPQEQQFGLKTQPTKRVFVLVESKIFDVVLGAFYLHVLRPHFCRLALQEALSVPHAFFDSQLGNSKLQHSTEGRQ